MMMFLVDNKEILEASNVGGKNNNLAKLVDLGFNVPAFAALPFDYLGSRISMELEGYVNEVDDITIPIEEIELLMKALNAKSDDRFAVRSSALEEDGKDQSFAGQFDSYLYVGQGEIAERIKDVWKSAASDHIKAYLQANGQSGVPRVGVVIQKMVKATKAGVAFGMDPTTGNRKGKVISALYGLGEGLVSGALNADTYSYNGTEWSEQLVDKPKKFDFSSESNAVVEMPVADGVSKSTLSSEEVTLIASKLDDLTKALKVPQDIEFSFDENGFYLLQTRPITSLGKVADKTDQYIVWDNSNIIESYPGVTTPMTFSFIRKMYEAVYVQFCEIMGVDKDDIQENRAVFENMLGLLNGRVYYNLLSWYKVLSLLPGYSVNAEFMEKMMGIKERFELPPKAKKISKSGAKIKLYISLYKMIGQLRRLPKERDAFIVFLNKTMKEYDNIALEEKSATELMDLYNGFERILLEQWKPPLVNDFFAMIFFGTLEKMCTKYELGPNIHNDLLCGSQDIISTEPVTRILSISSEIQNDAKTKAFFVENDALTIWKGLADYPSAYAAIGEYLSKFGERCVGELKLETESYNQSPERLVDIIKSYVVQGIVSRNSGHDLELKLRGEAQAIVNEKIKSPIKKAVFKYVLKKTRELVSNRENLRYERTRGFGMVRKIFSAMGDKFYGENLIDNPRDVFYLTKEEVFDFILGTAVTANLRALIKVRKEEFATYQSMDVPSERIPSYGMVYHANDFFTTGPEEEFEGDLKGIGACPGQVTAKVKVIKDPSEVKTLNGEILVTSSTDPGWVTLFPTASAILVERGSLLSHSAIVSRELGIPCVVGVTGLLKRLKTGDTILLDGSTGEIKILDDE